MSDPLIARFAAACGATAPLNLRVDLAGGSLLAEGSVDQPFTLVGRDDSCDVTLSDPDINPRHVWLQVLAGRVYAIDLGSRTGLVWPGGGRGSGWLDPGAGARLGPFLLSLSNPVGDRPGPLPPDYNPLAADTGIKSRPPVTLEFRNGKRARDRWAVNRLVTLVGRSPDCKIHLTADDISPYHCGLVSAPTGLWVVDLSGRGVVVNGERMRVAPLPHGAELWVGRFLIGCQTAPAPAGADAPTPPPARPAGAAPPDRAAQNASSSVNAPRAPALPPPAGPSETEDEVELGAAPDPAADLPNSHIMADAFRGASANGPSTGGPPSNSISVSSGSGPGPGTNTETPGGPLAGLLGALGLEHAPAAGPAPALRQMAELHDRAAHEFARWLALLPRLFEGLPREHLPVARRELNRIEELTAEIAALRSEVSRRAIERAVDERDRQAADPAHTPDTPAPVRALDTVTPSPLTPDRLAALQHERADRWAAVVALFAGG